MLKKTHDKSDRFAIYVRTSSGMQTELSLPDQEYLCREAIAERGGRVVDVYVDTAQSGWNINRPGLIALRRDAERGLFDAVMFWKFDRLSRNHHDTVTIKLLLRHEYGIKLYCVEGFSEDDDDSEEVIMMEQMLSIFYSFYSHNLSSDTKRGKRQRAMRGEFNGSFAPLGYILVTVRDSTPDRPAGLHIDPATAPIILQAFEKYATGHHSAASIAKWMNEQPAIQKAREGRIPLNKETVRDMLTNETYVGRVSYSETLYRGKLGEGKRSNRNRREWFEGKHEAIISDALFERCQQARGANTIERGPDKAERAYLLPDQVFCANCIGRGLPDVEDAKYGKMRARWLTREKTSYYHCLSKERGYGACSERMAVEHVETQVLDILFALQLPQDHLMRAAQVVSQRLDYQRTTYQMAQIKDIMNQMNLDLTSKRFNVDAYLRERDSILQEVESIRTIRYDTIKQAQDLLNNFQKHWHRCLLSEDADRERTHLIQSVVSQVFVAYGQVVLLVLHGQVGVPATNDAKALKIIKALGLVSLP